MAQGDPAARRDYPRLKGLPVMFNEPTMGSVYYVHNNDTAHPHARDTTAGQGTGGEQGKTPDAPFATIAYAVNRCTLDAQTGGTQAPGSIVYVMANHTETVAATTNLSVAGVRIIGLGDGDDRPTVTFATAAAADYTLAAANIRIENIRFVCNIASQTHMIDIGASGDGAVITNCEFLEGSTTGLSMIDITGVASDVKIIGNKFDAPTAGNYDEAIAVSAAALRVEISDNFIFGDFDEACIQNPTSAVALRIKIHNNTLVNTLTGQHAIQLVSAVTGVISNNRCYVDTLTAVIDPGSCYQFGNTVSLGADNGEVPTPPDATGTSVVVKESGSMASGYGTGDSPVTLFTVTGDVLARVVAAVDVNCTSTSNNGTLEAGVAGNTACLLVQDVVDGTAFQAGDAWSLATAANADGAAADTGWVVVNNGNNIILTIATNNMTAGEIDFYCEWKPLVAGSSVVAA